MPGSLIGQKNITRFLVYNGTADLVESAGTAHVNNLAADKIAVVNTGGDILTYDDVTTKTWADGSGNVFNKVRVAVNTNGKLQFSDDILWDKVSTRKYTEYVAPVEQVDYIGYNATTGSIDVTLPSTNYIIRLELIENQKQFGNKPMYKISEFKSSSTLSGTAAAQKAVAAGLISNLIANFKREPEQRIKFERVCDGALANALGTATTSVVNGSTAVVFSEDMTSLVVAGTILRLGGTGAGSTPCYVVSSTDGGAGAARIYFLDVPYQGATATISAANTESVTNGNWGIKLTGVALDFKAGEQNYEISRWNTSLNEEFGATLFTHLTSATYGIGTAKEMSELEWFLEGNETRGLRFRIPPYTPRTDVSTSLTYDVVNIDCTDNYTTPLLGGNALSFKSTLIAVNAAATQTRLKLAFNK